MMGNAARIGQRLIALAGGMAAPAVAADLAVGPGQSIQAAIQAAANGDQILVQPGTYHESLTLLGKSIQVLGVGGAAVTTVDPGGGNQTCVRFIGGEPPSAEIAGFTLRNGEHGVRIENGSGARVRGCVIEHNLLRGGASYNPNGPQAAAAVVFEECVIRDNEGPGLYGNVTARRCVISGNTRSGVVTTAGVLSDCTIRGNATPFNGGGIFMGGSTVVERCLIADNVAGLSGGGVFTLDAGTLSLTGCTVRDNTAGLEGGGILAAGGGNVALVGCAVLFNHSNSVGGGLHVTTTATVPGSQVALRRCVVAGNSAGLIGGGAYVAAQAGPGGVVVTEQCTFEGNTPDGVASSAFATAHTYGIFWNQALPFLPATGTLAVAFCDVSGGFGGTGNFNVDPHFVDAASGDFHLRADSPCRNLGGPTAGTDFEGDAVDGVADFGADEFRTHLYLSGVPTPGATVQLHLVGPPGVSPVLLFASLIRLPNGIATPYGPFYLGLPLLPGVPLALGAIPPNSALALAAPLPPSAPPGLAVHLQAFAGGVSPTLSNAALLLIE